MNGFAPGGQAEIKYSIGDEYRSLFLIDWRYPHP
jgi:hypothetical protein